ncbi:hypothetical protein [Stutzerimonas nitrititolerans]|uniref:hypothetical protein n=1 Tax=Stutzerimonas nitrititolerans TaxID=2482751 RepID=UPI0028A982EB|nr:hypothetical protein [Stutzerimonas nitrititolerans]
MQAVAVPLPPYHPRVLLVSRHSLFTALIPRYVAALRADASIPRPSISIEEAARGVLRRTLKLLVRHQGRVPVSEAVRFILNGDKPGEITDARRKIGLRLLELVVESSGLIQPNSSGATFSLHPDWSQRFVERFEAREAAILTATTHWYAWSPKAQKPSLEEHTTNQ